MQIAFCLIKFTFIK